MKNIDLRSCRSTLKYGQESKKEIWHHTKGTNAETVHGNPTKQCTSISCHWHKINVTSVTKKISKRFSTHVCARFIGKLTWFNGLENFEKSAINCQEINDWSSYLYEVRLFQAFLWIGNTKECYKNMQLPQSRQKEIEMVCLSIILPLWYIKVIKHLQCLLVVTDENDQHWKSVQIWTILSARWSVDGLPKELSGHSKTFWFFSNNLSLDQGISSCSLDITYSLFALWQFQKSSHKHKYLITSNSFTGQLQMSGTKSEYM